MFDFKRIETNMNKVMESKMKNSIMQMEQVLAEKMGKQFARMWEKAIDQF
jgi:hypothetical protein